MAFGSFLQRLLRVNATVPYSWTLPSADAAGALVSDGAGAMRMVQNPNSICDFRLTLTAGTPVTTADVNSATSVLCSPIIGNRIDLYDGTNWNRRTSAEFSISVVGKTASTPYDVFCYDNAGVPTLELLAWTNATTRATALTTQDGRLVKSGDALRLYLGSVFINSSGGQTHDAFATRYLFSYYNRRRRALRRLETVGSWTYTTATVRQANAATANQVEIMVGVADHMLELDLLAQSYQTNNGVSRTAGIGEDSTTTMMATAIQYEDPTGGVANPDDERHRAAIRHYPAVGWHKYCWNEISAAGVGTTTWLGTSSGVSAGNCGLLGSTEG